MAHLVCICPYAPVLVRQPCRITSASFAGQSWEIWVSLVTLDISYLEALLRNPVPSFHPFLLREVPIEPLGGILQYRPIGSPVRSVE